MQLTVNLNHEQVRGGAKLNGSINSNEIGFAVIIQTSSLLQ